MRIRVRLDVRKSLKIEKDNSKAVTFMYERLPTFCYLCGRIGHIDRYCEQQFRIPETEIVLLWSEELRVPAKRDQMIVRNQWLVPSVEEMRKEEIKSGMRKGTEAISNWGRGMGSNKPANIKALAVNFRASREFQDKMITYEAEAGTDDGAVVVQKDKKRRRGDSSRGSPMEVDKENRFVDHNIEVQASKNLGLAGSGTETCPPQ
ncbi:hypothetical protein LINPERHAP1_LOCUS36620 [Linum perenne]